VQPFVTIRTSFGQKFEFPCPRDAPCKILSHLVQQFWRRTLLKYFLLHDLVDLLRVIPFDNKIDKHVIDAHLLLNRVHKKNMLNKRPTGLHAHLAS